MMHKPNRRHRLKTKHSYHDAKIRAIHFASNDCIIELELCTGSPSAIVNLCFHSVRNRDDIYCFIETKLKNRRGTEIIGIMR
jgi:hypothetical protein